MIKYISITCFAFFIAFSFWLNVSSISLNFASAVASVAVRAATQSSIASTLAETPLNASINGFN